MRRWLCAAVFALLATAGVANAERVRYHFLPADICGNTLQTPAGRDNAIGERVSYLGLGNRPYQCPMPPTHMVTFYHPYSRQNVVVPMALPDCTPRLQTKSDRIVFNYGDYSVEAIFLPDGSVDTVYDSGMFRPLPVR
jgi:hypothetical protein